MHAEGLAALARAVRARYVAQLRASAERVYPQDPDFALGIKTEAAALEAPDDPAFAELKPRLINYELLIAGEVNKAARRDTA